jgi:hypothetical protein
MGMAECRVLVWRMPSFANLSPICPWFCGGCNDSFVMAVPWSRLPQHTCYVQIVTSVQLGVGWVLAAIVAAALISQFTLATVLLCLHQFNEDVPHMLYGIGWLTVLFAFLMPVVAIHHFPLVSDNRRISELHRKKRRWLAFFLWLLRVDVLLAVASLER